MDMLHMSILRGTSTRGARICPFTAEMQHKAFNSNQTISRRHCKNMEI